MNRTYTFLFIGDSLTDVGRVGGENAPLGRGYPRLVRDLLVARHPEKRLAVINKGLSGNTIANLAARWKIDVLHQRPDWLGILIGANDIGYVLQKWEGWQDHTPSAYGKHYENILAQTRRHLPHCHITLMEPFYLTVDRSANQRAKVRRGLRAYRDIVRAMSRRFKTECISFQPLFDQQLRAHGMRTFTLDGAHPNLNGAMLMADRILSVIEPLIKKPL
ncbi:MAG: SGNH/GDSL hydrolase family protein [Kiritimatiellae bacterium]|nr:SGNH/GDSL hydrolase family protein [Kiritimatiellia bacterium]